MTSYLAQRASLREALVSSNETVFFRLIEKLTSIVDDILALNYICFGGKENIKLFQLQLQFLRTIK